MPVETVQRQTCEVRCKEVDRRLGDIEDNSRDSNGKIDTQLKQDSKDIKELTVISAKLTQIAENAASNAIAMEKRLALLEKTLMQKNTKANPTVVAVLSQKTVQFFFIVLGVCLLAITLTAVNQGSLKDVLDKIPK
jgi:hypothetical protein